MNFESGTLQDWFYKQEEHPNLFPGKKQYVSFYKAFKGYMDKEIHPHIGTIMSREDYDVFLNDHSGDHVDMVIEKASSILQSLEETDILTPYEAFMLLTAIQIHDAGHIINANRETHAMDSGELLQKLDDQVTTWEKAIVTRIAQAHTGNEDLIGKQKVSEGSGNDRIRYRFLSSVLRMADELADGHDRAANYLLKEKKIPEKSEIFHAFSSCLEKFYVDLKSHEINMIFCLNKNHSKKLYKKLISKTNFEEKFLIDEIYSRTIKTFNECLYFNRFVPENLRISSVKVEIHFKEAGGKDDFFDQIDYRIEEIGYPILSSNDIFKIGKGNLEDDGVKKDGKYIANKIK